MTTEELRAADALSMEEYELDKLSRHWPDVLVKASMDNFSYHLQLRNGTVLRFESAEPCRDPAWVHLKLEQGERPAVGSCADRGIEIRLADIVWIADQGNEL